MNAGNRAVRLQRLQSAAYDAVKDPMAHPTTMQHAQPTRRPDPDELSAPATQVVGDRNAYLGNGKDVGRRLSDEQFELFVGDDAAGGLQRELQRLAPPFIALHDVGTSSSLRLLQAMAANQGKLARLTIRRQGHGIPLATLQFIELPGADGSSLRVYSTDVDADSQSRHALARVLVSHAPLAVLVFGELPAHALGAALKPLLDAVERQRWATRMMLMLPLGATAPVSGFARDFGRHGLQVNVTPRVTHPGEAWSYIGSTWNQIEGLAAQTAAAGADGSASPAQAPGATPAVPAQTSTAAPMPASTSVPARVVPQNPTSPLGAPLAPAAGPNAALAADPGHMPALKSTQASTQAPVPRYVVTDQPTQPMGLEPEAGVDWWDFIQRCAGVQGMVACCVFDRNDGKPLAHVGGLPSAELMQTLGEQMLGTASRIGAMMGTGAQVLEARVSTATHHLLLRSLPSHPGVALHAVIDASEGELVAAQRHLRRIEPS